MYNQGLLGVLNNINTNAQQSTLTSDLDNKLPKKDSKKTPNTTEYDFGQELKQNSTKIVPVDNKSITEVVKNASLKSGINPSLLMSSGWIEGMNKAILKPDDASEAYVITKDLSEKDKDDYPVDGFFNYGLDTFGTNYNKLKKYLPEGFESKFKVFNAKNEKNENIKTAAFKTNEDALTAKAAMLKSEQDNVNDYASKRGIKLDPDALDYFTMASYNGGFGKAKKMLDEYDKYKDKSKFISEGATSLKAIHNNISKRMKIRSVANELLNSKS